MSINYQLKKYKQLRGGTASYKIISAMGGGGHGETYKAKVSEIYSKNKYLKNNQEVVIKIPKLKIDTPTEEKMKRLLKVFETFMVEASLLKHLMGLRCVAHVLDYGTYQYKLNPKQDISAPALFIVQELIKGESLDVFMKSKFGSGKEFSGIPTADKYFEWTRKLAYSLLQIHQNQIVHGDIWPNNIIVNSDEAPVFIDFGQAHFRELSFGPIGQQGASHPYVAPEGSGSVGADIYSLGGVLFYLATGNIPPLDIKDIRDIDDLKNKVTDEVIRCNVQLYEENCGVIDVITRCLRFSQHDRIPHAEGLLQDVETFSTTASLDGKIKDLTNILKKLDIENNELFSWMARLRIRVLSRGIEDMTHGIYDLIGDHESIVSGLTQYLSFLQEGDQYLTISIPLFWQSKNIGINGRFLTMNKLAAQRGATIRRIFLITSEDKLNPETQKIISSHRRVMDELTAKGVNSLNPNLTAGGFYTGFKEVDKNVRDKMYRERKHFGLLVKKGKDILIFPIYREDETIVTIQFRATSDFGRSQQNDFNTLLLESKPIQEYPL